MYLPENLVRGTTRPKIEQPFLGSVPLVPVSQILAGCFIRWRLPDWSCYSNTNSLAQTEIKWAAHQRLLDWSWSQQNREKPKGQLGGDCLTGIGPNRNGENQRGSSAETARRVLLTTETGKTKRQLSRDCSTSFVHNRNGENQRGSSPETARLVLVPTERGKPTAAHRRLLDQFWSLNPKGRQSTLDTAWSRGAEGVVM